MEHDRGTILMVPLFILNGDLDSGPDGVAHDDEFLADTADIISTCVVGIHEFWRNYQKPPSGRGRSRPGDHRHQ
jgi:hypothetical protein